MRYLITFFLLISSYANSNELINKSLICNADDPNMRSFSFAKQMGFEFKNKFEVIRYQEPFYYETENQRNYKPRKTKLKYDLTIDQIRIYNDPKVYKQKVDYRLSRYNLKYKDVVEYTCEIFTKDLDNYFQKRIDIHLKNVRKKRKL